MAALGLIFFTLCSTVVLTILRGLLFQVNVGRLKAVRRV